jgi:biotin carboxylase
VIYQRIMRAANELGCKTVGIFAHEDRLQQHRYKADQAFLVGQGKSPVGTSIRVTSMLSRNREIILIFQQARISIFRRSLKSQNTKEYKQVFTLHSMYYQPIEN